MANFKQLMILAGDENFKARVKYAMQNAAIAVMAEGTGVVAHTQRAIYAGKILDGTASIFEYSIGVLNNATIANAVSVTSSDAGVLDSDIQVAVNSEFNAFSGIS